MTRDKSEMYIAQTFDGQLLTVTEYAALRADLQEPPTIVCPRCLDDGDYQHLEFDPASHRFIHRDGPRGCYRDERSSRAHDLAQQTGYKHLASGDQYDEVEIEYNLGNNYYDIGAGSVANDELKGIVVEIQHLTGAFRMRIPRKLRVAHAHDHGVYVVLTPSASERSWFEQKLRRGMNDADAQAGRYEQGDVELGTFIHPNEFDLSVFRDYSYPAGNSAE